MNAEWNALYCRPVPFLMPQKSIEKFFPHRQHRMIYSYAHTQHKRRHQFIVQCAFRVVGWIFEEKKKKIWNIIAGTRCRQRFSNEFQKRVTIQFSCTRRRIRFRIRPISIYPSTCSLIAEKKKYIFLMSSVPVESSPVDGCNQTNIIIN